MSFGGGTTGITYAEQTGRYRKIGSMVTAWGRLTLSNNGSSSGVAKITGLPFTSSADVAQAGYVGYYGGLVAGIASVLLVVAAGTTTVEMRHETAGTCSNIDETGALDSTDIIFTLPYFV